MDAESRRHQIEIITGDLEAAPTDRERSGRLAYAAVGRRTPMLWWRHAADVADWPSAYAEARLGIGAMCGCRAFGVACILLADGDDGRCAGCRAACPASDPPSPGT